MPIRAQVDAYQTQIIFALQARGYAQITPMRISYQPSANANLSQIQGLLRAQHSEQGRVIVKWEINIDCLSTGFGSLHHEITVLKHLLPVSSLPLPPVITHYSALPLANHQTATVLITKDCGSDLRVILRQPTDINKPKIIQRIAAALYELQHAGWLHNDIKPSNILCNEDNFITLCDFALSCPVHNDAATPMGTPAYLAPERWHGEPATVQTDIYAFGVLMYDILAGQRPYQIDTAQAEKNTTHAWAMQHCQAPIPKLPAEYTHWQHLIEGCLAKHKNNRYRDMLAVMAAIDKVNK